MPNILPSNDKLVFILCDDVRQEVGGKVTLTGVYSSGDVRVNGEVADPTTEEVFLSSLALYFNFADGEGEFKGRVTIKTPSGIEILNHKYENLKKVANEGMTTILRASPFKVHEYGVHTVSFILDKKTYTRTFNVQPEPSINQH